MKTHLRRLLMCCLLLLILPMAAFAEENELPVEWVLAMATACRTPRLWTPTS